MALLDERLEFVVGYNPDDIGPLADPVDGTGLLDRLGDQPHRSRSLIDSARDWMPSRGGSNTHSTYQKNRFI
jgi:hypothetical protein